MLTSASWLSQRATISAEAFGIENLTMPRFPQEHDRESLQTVIDLSLENGLIDQEVTLEDLAREGA